MGKFSHALETDGEIVLANEILSPDPVYLCPVCKQPILIFVREFVKSGTKIASHFRTKKGCEHQEGCRLTQSPPIIRLNANTAIISFPYERQASENATQTTAHSEGRNDQGNQSRLLGLPSIKSALLDLSIENVKIGNYIVTMDEFIRKYFIYYWTDFGSIANREKLLFIGRVTWNDGEGITTVNLSKNYDRPRIRIHKKPGLSDGDMVLIYAKKTDDIVRQPFTSIYDFSQYFSVTQILMPEEFDQLMNRIERVLMVTRVESSQKGDENDGPN